MIPYKASFSPFKKTICYRHILLQVEFCRLANLPDLMQESEYVADTLLTWINTTIATYGFDGIRIDTVPEVSESVDLRELLILLSMK